jgi:uncharacterized Zn-binding protein involved in type VI secretion
MAFAHRNLDPRSCGATTTTVGQNYVTINGQFWAVAGDPCSHGGGQLIPQQNFISIDGKYVLGVGDHASPDGLSPDNLDNGVTAHDDPIATGSGLFVDILG